MYKKIAYGVSIIALVCIVMMSFLIITKSNYSFAQDLTITGNDDGLLIQPNSKLFDVACLNPGDNLESQINIKNNYKYPFDLYMKAERVTDSSVDANADLYKKLVLNVSCDNKVVYNGPMNGFDGNSIYIGKFASGDTKNIESAVSLNGVDTGNEYQGKSANVNWVFTASVENTQQVNGNPSNSTMPKTGDNSFIFLYAACAVFLITGTTLVIKSKLNK